MLRILKKALFTGVKSEALGEAGQQIETVGPKLEAIIKKRFQGSLAIRAVDAGSCNGCELEIHATNNC
ncbi:MAG: hydrogenase, partial [Mariprofundus sp.]|nr:hydrogenase [Mariprofundus sp.]